MLTNWIILQVEKLFSCLPGIKATDNTLMCEAKVVIWVTSYKSSGTGIKSQSLAMTFLRIMCHLLFLIYIYIYIYISYVKSIMIGDFKRKGFLKNVEKKI